MRYPQGDLAILSAETYDPGSRPVPTRGKKTQQPAATRESGRKRKTQSSDDGSDNQEEEKKRSRGRPRLDTNDETAAERRRTQIRLAQRAYRNRKENAIQTLERKVQELKETNEEMSNAFMKLHDFAVGHGLLDIAPEFALQLRATTEMFLSLARRSSDDGGKDEEQLAGEEKSASTQAEQTISGHLLDLTIPKSKDVHPPAPPQLMGGLMVSHDSMPENKVASTEMQLSLSVAVQNPNLDYEVITYPTLENASFPFGTDFTFSSGENTGSSTPLFRELPPPKSYANQETTFGRRLHRTAAERALDLISMANPPPRRFARVFGFCLLFETQESIRKRLQTVVERNRQESLFNWEYPFLNLGGSGTHYDMTNFSGQSVGNQGTVDIRKPRSTAGLSTGPFGSKIMEAGNLLDKSFRMDLPGFRADFYDCDEVEVYLRERGVTIPGGAEYVTAEIDLGDFEDTEEEANAAHPFEPPEFLENGKPNSELGMGTVGDFAAALNAAHTNSRSPSVSTGDASTAITVPSPGPESAKAWNLPSTPTDPLLDGSYSVPTSAAFMNPVVTAGDFNSGSLLAFSSFGMIGRDGGSKRQLVTVDVNMLIYEMIERAACLGKSPGLRKTDINAAFAIAARYF